VSASDLSNDLLLAQNVLPKASPGVAQDAAPTPASGGGSSSLTGFTPILIMLVFFVPIWLLSSRRQKKEATARASLKRGDQVTTTSGLIGELVEMDDRIAKVKIAPGTTVQIVANTISPYAEPDKGAPKELKEAKAAPDKK
jgi:preprotein translocase subunit YajC